MPYQVEITDLSTALRLADRIASRQCTQKEVIQLAKTKPKPKPKPNPKPKY